MIFRKIEVRIIDLEDCLNSDSLLCERVGITTAAELDNFKQITNVHDNEALIKRLALYVASGVTYEEVLEHKRIYDKL